MPAKHNWSLFRGFGIASGSTGVRAKAAIVDRAKQVFLFGPGGTHGTQIDDPSLLIPLSSRFNTKNCGSARISKHWTSGRKLMPHYVIVGAGSAGCVLAARLSEDPAAEVVLIEAGPPDKAEQIHIPVAWPQLFKSRYDWDYASEREPGLDRRRVYLPRGKTLGGSSSMNAMAYIRGARADYDGWARDGAKGWAYDDLLPYFRRSEANERGEDQFHGNLGPLTVSDGRSRYSLMDAFVEAGVEAGHLRNPDFNGEKQDGLGLYQLTQRNGMRCSAAVAFLHPAVGRPNLKVVTDALATRILFDGARAHGVEVARHGELQEFYAETEVIVSAGAYNSPQFASCFSRGSGPAADLAQPDDPAFALSRSAGRLGPAGSSPMS